MQSFKVTACSFIVGSIGIEYDHANLAVKAKLKEALKPKNGEFHDVGEMTMKMRMVKSSEELELYRKTAKIADLGGFAARQVIQENVSEYQISGHATRAMVSEIAREFGPRSELRDTWVWLQSGAINTDGAHNPVTCRLVITFTFHSAPETLKM